MNVEKEKKFKQPYEKPVLRTIDLAAEEVLAKVCKRTSIQVASGISRCDGNACKQLLGS